MNQVTNLVPTNAASGSIAVSNGAAHVMIPHVANRAVEVQSTTNLFNTNSWSALNQLDNAPLYPATNRTTIVSDPASSTTPKYYRVRVYEP